MGNHSHAATRRWSSKRPEGLPRAAPYALWVASAYQTPVHRYLDAGAGEHDRLRCGRWQRRSAVGPGPPGLAVSGRRHARLIRQRRPRRVPGTARQPLNDAGHATAGASYDPHEPDVRGAAAVSLPWRVKRGRVELGLCDAGTRAEGRYCPARRAICQPGTAGSGCPVGTRRGRCAAILGRSDRAEASYARPARHGNGSRWGCIWRHIAPQALEDVQPDRSAGIVQ